MDGRSSWLLLPLDVTEHELLLFFKKNWSCRKLSDANYSCNDDDSDDVRVYVGHRVAWRIRVPFFLIYYY